ncbi:MAG: hypothetical protein F4Z74_07795 [Acidobacteria bacterium]|nr:hypothetical protein [Acidobacteriota bacterium]MYE44448.1 hypothetical protein [Acidobacteriota bacterium]
MSPTPLDGADHVVRYCRPRTVDSQGRVTSAAFVFRTTPNREHFLSVNWLEYFQAATRKERVRLLRELLGRKLRLSQKGRLGVLQVGCVRGLAQDSATDSVRVERHPSHDDHSHAGIHVASEQEVAAAVVLANLVEEVFPGTG